MNGSRFPTIFAIGLGIAVMVGWLLSLSVEVYTHATTTAAPYTTPAAVHGLMGIVVGAVYASWRVAKRNEGDDGHQ